MQLRHVCKGHVQLYSVNSPQNSESRQPLLAWCWLHWEHVKEQLMRALLERDIRICWRRFFSLSLFFFFLFFIFCCSEGIWRRKRTPVPKIKENASEHSTDCVQSVYNCVSCEPCPPSMLGSHAPFHTTLIYMRESELILCVVCFLLFFLKIISLASVIIFRMYNVLGSFYSDLCHI